MNLFLKNFKEICLIAILYLFCNLFSLQINFSFYPYVKIEYVSFKKCKKYIRNDY
jgi:hypothetical protein